jgi:hypothetical protein
MAFKKSSTSTQVTSEERRLIKEQREILRRKQELEKKLHVLPKQIEAQKKKEQKLRVETSGSVISFGGARSAHSARSQSRKKIPHPARELQSARIKFLVLCLILATIVIMLWRVIPT